MIKSRLPKDIRPQDIHLGLSDEFTRSVSYKDVMLFAEVSGDHNPLHTNEIYARTTNYSQPIVHGAFQIAMASEFVGMYLPGLNVILSSVQAKFIAPLYYPCKVKIMGEIVSWDKAGNRGAVKIKVVDLENFNVTSEITMGVTVHASAGVEAIPSVSSKHEISSFSGKKIVLLTGATGGIGGSLVGALKHDYDVICVGRNAAGLSNLCAGSGLIPLNLSLEHDILGPIKDVLEGRYLYGVVHAAWPSVPKGGLLGMSPDIINNQIQFGCEIIVQLAKALYTLTDSSGGRLIALGSTYARIESVASIPAYSLGKSVLEDTVRLLAAELSRKRITANVIAPSFVPTGMNKTVPNQALAKVTAGVPMGRLCSEVDIAAMVKYFLSSESEFVSGQSIALTGAKR